MVEVKWASYGDWSGPWIKGARVYVPAQAPTSWENVLVYAVAYPEGSTWDGFVAYDGTAATAGIFQWTLTSGRLQKLLEVCRTAAPKTWAATVGKLLTDWHLILKNGKICTDNGVPLPSPSGLRAKFTPPDGKTPKVGTNWNLASYSATSFNALFLDPALDKVQQDFFLNELRVEAAFKRPKLNNMTINDILYPTGWPTAGATALFPADGVRALFWSAWQNSPRTAEEYLYASNSEIQFKADPLSFSSHFTHRIAHSTFGNWGIEKAAANNREARYTKMINCINSQIRLCQSGTYPVLPGGCQFPQNP